MDVIATLPTKPTQPNKKKTRSFDEILRDIRLIGDIKFSPFQPKAKQQARAVLPSFFPKNPHLFDYFSLFFTLDLLQTITTNTNRYASLQKLHVL
jgi:hypothetical protein